MIGFFRPALALVLALAAAGSLSAATPSLPPLAEVDVEAARASIERGGLSEEQLQQANAALDAARAHEDQAQAAILASAALREAAASAERETRQLERELAQPSERSFQEWRRALPVDIDGDQLESQLASERAEVLLLRAEVTDLRQTLGSQATDVLSDIERDAELQLQIEALKRRIETPATIAADEPLAMQQARLAQQKAELRAQSAELARRQLERETAPARRGHLELRLRRAQHDLSDREQRVEVLQAQSLARQNDAMKELLARLQGQVDAHAEGDPLLRNTATDTLEIGRTLASTMQAIAALRADEASRLNERDSVAAALRDTQARLAVEGQDDSLGQILVLERRRLGSPDIILGRLEDVRQALTRARLRQIALGDQRLLLADLPGAVATAVTAAEPAGEAEAVLLRGELYALLGERAELLPRLDSALQRHIGALAQAEANLQAQLVDTRKLRELLDRRIYWIPSNGAVDSAWLGQVGAGWADLLKPARFVTSARLAWERIVEKPVVPLLVLLLFLAGIYVRQRLPTLMPRSVPPLRRPAEDNFAFTWKALGLTAAAALPWAILVWGLGHVLRSAGEPGLFSHSLGGALLSVSSSIFLLHFMRYLVVEQGLAHLHFRWMRGRREAIARALPLATTVLLPLQFVVVLALTRNQELAIDTAARMALVAFCLVVAFELKRILAPGAIWSTRGGRPEPRRLRQVLRIGLILLFLQLAAMILAGYVFSGAVILGCLWATLGTVAAVGTLHGLLSRWFLLGERRLALKRNEARRQAAAQEASSSGSDEAAAGVGDELLALETVNVQTGRLLRALTLALWVGGLFWVWSDVLPALGRLDETVLWSVASLADDGSAIREAVSLRSVLFGALMLVLTIIAARNLPGLMELAVLSRTSIDPASRYAITSVSRYAIVIVGSLIGLSLLGLRWSQLQWMAAALTVGLGFGLQEIFANFVSGLILLSERPFRVGDVITIGDQTGTVTRISTRATTLVDFDGKELVVPNKTFITDRLVNWTLSDTQTRLIIKIGVAYGTAPEQVHRLLQQIAEEHPLVLREPQPRSWFMAFGASSLDFELRVFVATISDRLPVMNEINGRIATLFAEQGIDIAFPQLDLHVRTLPPRTEPGSMPAAPEHPDAQTNGAPEGAPG